MTFWLMIVFGIVAAFTGAAIGDEEGFFAGLAIGVLAGAYFGLGRKVNALTKAVEKLEIGLAHRPGIVPDEGPSAAQTEPPPAPVQAGPNSEPEPEPPRPAPGPAAPTPIPADPWLQDSPRPAPRTATGVRPPRGPQAPRVIVAIERGIEVAKRFFTTGNIVVKVGVVVLFFGVAFLLRYAAERDVFPIELRLAAVAAGGIALLIVGWRLRVGRPAYALVLQGGAVGILFLTVFAAARLYHVVPMGMAFVLMTAFVVLSAILAVLQNAPALAAFGTAGGFLAPVLTSTGEGSHVALFGYYALLNAGIVGIAWFKAWRILNWLGFVFTFVIGTSWGYRYYVPHYFASTEPFLIVFFLFYVAITVLFAHRQPPKLKGLVDGTLVFGVPIVGFALQTRLVRDFEFGDAYTAVTMGLFYIGLATVLWRRRVEGMRVLTESFLALGVVFGTLAIPFALDGRWTAAAWSLEAAGIVWVGLRQQRILARVFGFVLQVGAALLFLTQIQDPIGELPALNSAYVGCVLIGVAGLFTAHQYARHLADVRDWERPAEVLLLVWGLGWWLGSGLMEIGEHIAVDYRLTACILFVSLSALLLSGLAARLRWRNALYPSLGLLPVLTVFGLYQFADGAEHGPWHHHGFIAWVVAITAHFTILRWYAGEWSASRRTMWHAGSLSLITFILTWALAAFVNDVSALSDTWVLASCAALPGAIVAVLRTYGDRVRWPVAAFPASYQRAGQIPIHIALWLWVLVSCWQSGDPAPLPYVPIINPIDLGVLFFMLVFLQWWWSNRDQPPVDKIRVIDGVILIGVVAFIWLNAVVVRTIHHVMEVPFASEAMWRTPALQTSITLTWTVLGCLLMAFSSVRLRLRGVWIGGASLLGVVVVKLFLIDLADIGTVARIVSFMGVGLLLLVIGYIAPIPPRRREPQAV